MNALEICIVTFGIVAIFVKLAVSCLLWTDMIWEIPFTPRRKKNDPKDPYSTAKFVTLDQVRDLIDKKTSNCMQVGGKSHNDILHDLKRVKQDFRVQIHPATYTEYEPTGTLWQHGQMIAMIAGGESRGGQFTGFRIVAADDPQWRTIADNKYAVACSGPGYDETPFEATEYTVQKAIDQADADGIAWEMVCVAGNTRPLKGADQKRIDSAYLPPVILSRILLGQAIR